MSIAAINSDIHSDCEACAQYFTTHLSTLDGYDLELACGLLPHADGK